MKPSGIGGQAVLEGVMMKNRDQYAVAVRKPDQDIVVEKKEYHSIMEKHRFLGIPFLRGVVSFVESMVLGMKTLTFSAGFFEEEEKEKAAPDKTEKKNGFLGGKAESLMMGLTVLVSILLAVGIFMLLPFWIASLLEKAVKSNMVLTLIEGGIRIVIFVGYVTAISMMKDIRRVFMYHGAEHKSINCIEHGFPLTVENVKKQSTRHKRCGTSFMLFVILLSVIFFMFIRVDNMWMRMVFRILLIPVIAGVSYELIRLAGRSENRVVNALSKPGLWLQGLTTREPDEDMIEVAIRSVEAVFDWRAFLNMEPEEPSDSAAEAAEKKNARPGKRQEAAGKRKNASGKPSEGTGRKEKSGVPETKIPDLKDKADPDSVVREEREPEAEQELAASVDPAAERLEKQKARAAGKPSEPIMAAEPEEEEDDDILNALDRFFTYKKEEKRGK